MGTLAAQWGEHTAIDADLLERMARIAHGLPGHMVSVDAADDGEINLWPAGDADREQDPVVRIDGVVAREILEHYRRLLELG